MRGQLISPALGGGSGNMGWEKRASGNQELQPNQINGTYDCGAYMGAGVLYNIFTRIPMNVNGHYHFEVVSVNSSASACQEFLYIQILNGSIATFISSGLFSSSSTFGDGHLGVINQAGTYAGYLILASNGYTGGQFYIRCRSSQPASFFSGWAYDDVGPSKTYPTGPTAGNNMQSAFISTLTGASLNMTGGITFGSQGSPSLIQLNGSELSAAIMQNLAMNYA